MKIEILFNILPSTTFHIHITKALPICYTEIDKLIVIIILLLLLEFMNYSKLLKYEHYF